MNRHITTWTGILGVILFVVTSILAALQSPGYSHVSQLISESYSIDTPYGRLLRFFGYLPSGICLTVFAFSAIGNFRKSNHTKLGFWGLGLFYGVATIVVSIFPCDKGCNKEFIDPSISQVIHSTVGLLTYLFTPIGLILIGIGVRKEARALSSLAYTTGLLSILFISILFSNPLSEFAGLSQRIIEGSILCWVLACALHINRAMHLGDI
ncbi:MAG: DUF998 domain-containing protein [Cyclobacteriaceae bacterium]